MKKVIFIVCAVFFLAGCKKEKIEPVESTIESKSENSKITYSISKQEGSNVVSKSFYKWNSEGRLIEMTSYADSNGSGFKIFEKRQLEYSNNKVSKSILSNFNWEDSTLKDQLTNVYRYDNKNLIFNSSHFKTFKSTAKYDYIDSNVAKIIKDSLLYIVHFRHGFGIVDNINNPDTIHVEYLINTPQNRKIFFYKNIEFVDNEGISRFGQYTSINKVDKKVSIGTEANDLLILEYLDIENPFSDITILDENTDYSTIIIKSWLYEFNMNKMQKRIKTSNIDGKYDYIFDSNGLLKELNLKMITTDTQRTINTTYYY